MSNVIATRTSNISTITKTEKIHLILIDIVTNSDIINYYFYRSSEIMDYIRHELEGKIQYYDYSSIEPIVINEIKELFLYFVNNMQPENRQIDFENIFENQIIISLTQWKSEVIEILQNL